MMKKFKLIYLISTGLLTALMLFSAGMYFFNYSEISPVFVALGFPTFIIYPLGVAKLLGLLALWTNQSKSLKEWAYAGFCFNFLLASGAHLNIGDGEHGGAVFALILLGASYYAWKKKSA